MSRSDTFHENLRMQPHKRKKEQDSYEEQMELFKAQMSFVDSLLQVEGDKGENGNGDMRRSGGDQFALDRWQGADSLRLLAESSTLKAQSHGK